MLHLHYGFGKGKTTSSVGAIIRMVGHGRKALFCQFLKDGKSGEVVMLKRIGVDYRCPRIHLNKISNAFLFADATLLLTETNNYGIIVLDEVLDAIVGGAILEESLLEFIDICKEKNIELIITGHYEPSQFIRDRANYITLFTKIHHPFDDGVQAREGIEY